MSQSYYFGCGRESGHYWWPPSASPFLNAKVNRLMGPGAGKPGTCPWGWEVDGAVQPKKTWNGPCRLHHKDGWTLLGWWDNSVDNRPGSCSAFAHEGTLTFDEMKVLFQKNFPWAHERLLRELTLVEE